MLAKVREQDLHSFRHFTTVIISESSTCTSLLVKSVTPPYSSYVSHYVSAECSIWLILVAVRSKANVCSRLSAGIASSNPPEGMDVRLLFLLCVV